MQFPNEKISNHRLIADQNFNFLVLRFMNREFVMQLRIPNAIEHGNWSDPATKYRQSIRVAVIQYLLISLNGPTIQHTFRIRYCSVPVDRS